MIDGVLLYCDEGPGVGLGHRRRCEGIAEALRVRGIQTAVLAVSDGIVAAPFVVVDSYRVRADDRRHFVPDVVVALDDLGRDLAVDCIVAPSPGARADVYTRAANVLAGAQYAIVGPPDAGPSDGCPSAGGTFRDSAVVFDDLDATSVLVAVGASDGDGIGARIAATIVAARPDLRVRLVVGPWGAPEVPDGVEAIVGARGLGAELARAAVVVTAGGLTLLEALQLGRPCVTFAVADNQRPNVEAIGAARAAIASTWDHAAAAACVLVDDAPARAALSAKAMALIDGRGAHRVADVMLGLLSRHAAA